jgi:arsenical pump membrane protein
MWFIAVLAAAGCVASRALPWPDAIDTTQRVGPVLVFLAAITVVAELADAAHVFDVAAVQAARIARGRTPVLFGLVLLLGTLTTIVLSLDTTAVLLTPVVLALASRLDLPPVPFAMTAVWLANTASMLLPVSNLTNLLAVDRLHLSAVAFAARMWLPAIAALATTAIVLGLVYRRELRGRYLAPPDAQIADPALLRLATGTCIGVVPFFVAGFPVWAVALVAAAVLIVAFAVRRPDLLRFALVPWRLILLVEGSFLIIATLGVHGLDTALGHLAGHSDSALGMARTTGIGAGASNLVNNLPSYLALERVADGRHNQLLALLLGTNLGPLVLLWGSLATLLWRDRCRARGVHISPWHFARVGLLGVPPMLALSWLALLVSR